MWKNKDVGGSFIIILVLVLIVENCGETSLVMTTATHSTNKPEQAATFIKKITTETGITTSVMDTTYSVIDTTSSVIDTTSSLLDTTSSVIDNTSSLIDTTSSMDASSTSYTSSNIIRSVTEAEQFVLKDDKTQRFITSFENKYQRTLIEIQLQSCPFDPLCGHALNVTHSTRFVTVSCCQPCSCDTLVCVRENNCCPDILQQFYIQRYILRSKCISSFMDVTSKRHDGFTGFDSCPVDTYVELNHNCTRPYTPTIAVLDDILPTYSSTISAVYRNKYCALCHGEGYRNLEFSRIKLYGPIKYSTMIFTEQEMINRAASSGSFALEFVFPEHVNINTCLTAIGTCNVTGKWDTYDIGIEAACHLYTAEILDGALRFKNVFCLLCNGLKVTKVICIGHDTQVNPYGFSGLLSYDFADVPADESRAIQNTCAGGKYYDTLQGQCKETTCSEIHTRQHGECVPMYEYLEDVAYFINIRLMPLDTVIVNTTYPHTEYILDALVNQLNGTLAVYVCGSQTLYFVNLPFNITYIYDSIVISQATISYLEIRLQLHVTKFIKGNPKDIVGTLLDTFHDKYITVEIDEFSVGFKMKVFSNNSLDFFYADEILYFFSMYPIVSNESMSVYSLALVIPNSFSDNFVLYFLRSGPLNKPCFTRPLKRNKHFLDILKIQQCLKINLSLSDVFWNRSTNGTLMFENNFFLDSNMYSVEDNGTISTCVEYYQMYVDILLDHAAVDAVVSSTSSEAFVSLFCSSLSILALSITLITFTFLPTLRKNIPGKNTMILVLTLLLANLLFVLSSFGGLETEFIGCKVIGLLLHLFWLLSMSWMNVSTFHLARYLTRVECTSTSPRWKRIFVYQLYATLVALSFIGINVTVSEIRMGTFGYGIDKCYISSSTMLLITFALPVSLLIVSNVLMFCIVIIKIRCATQIVKHIQNERNDFIIFLKLSTLTGITWVFGIANIWVANSVLDYIFSVLNASQGVFIFMAFVANKRVLVLYKQLILGASGQH